MTPEKQAKKLYTELKNKLPKSIWFLKKWYTKRGCYDTINYIIRLSIHCNNFERIGYWREVEKEIKKI